MTPDPLKPWIDKIADYVYECNVDPEDINYELITGIVHNVHEQGRLIGIEEGYKTGRLDPRSGLIMERPDKDDLDDYEL